MGRRDTYFNSYSLLLGFVTSAILMALFVFVVGLQPYLAWIASASLTTFALFGIDKALAVTSRNRIPERVLHLFTLLGGFIGQLAGRLLFRHKINFRKHPSFTITPIIGMILWAVIGYLLFVK